MVVERKESLLFRNRFKESRVLQSIVEEVDKFSLWHHRLGHAPVQCLQSYHFWTSGIVFSLLSVKQVNLLKSTRMFIVTMSTKLVDPLLI